MLRRIPFVPMCFGACGALALQSMLAMYEPALNNARVYVAGAALGAAYNVLLYAIFSFVRSRDASAPHAIGCGCAYAFAGYFFLVPIAIISGVATQRDFDITGITHVLASTVAFAGLGILGGILVARLRRAEDERQRAALETQQLELARDLQQRLLPPPSFESELYRVEARNVPAAYVAGDFYDVLPLPDGGVLVVVADVAGKGVAAGLIMATVKGMIPLLIAENPSPSSLLRRLNDRLAQQLGRRQFVALLAATFDASGVMSLANAGMPDPLIVEWARAKPVVVPGPRYPLGIRANIDYETLTLQLGEDERMFFYSDGLPEASLHGELAGYERIANEVQLAGADIEIVFQRLRNAGATIDDDWTAVSVRRQASGTSSSAADERFASEVT